MDVGPKRRVASSTLARELVESSRGCVVRDAGHAPVALMVRETANGNGSCHTATASSVNGDTTDGSSHSAQVAMDSSFGGGVLNTDQEAEDRNCRKPYDILRAHRNEPRSISQPSHGTPIWQDAAADSSFRRSIDSCLSSIRDYPLACGRVGRGSGRGGFQATTNVY